MLHVNIPWLKCNNTSNRFSLSKNLVISIVSSLSSCVFVLVTCLEINWCEPRQCFIDSNTCTMDIQNGPQHYPPDSHQHRSTDSQDWYQYLHPHPWHCHLELYKWSHDQLPGPEQSLHVRESQGKDQRQLITKDLNLTLPQDNLQGCEIHQVLAYCHAGFAVGYSWWLSWPCAIKVDQK